MVLLKVVSAVNRSSGFKHPCIHANILCRKCTDEASKKNNGKHDNVKNKSEEALEEPTTCCMSGCQNCVWLEYAEKLTKIYGNKGAEAALKEIEEKVTDPNIKAFILHELRMRKPK